MSEELLLKSMEELFEQAPCGFLLTQADGAIIRVNQTLLSWIGHDRDELLIGRRFQDLLTMPGRIYYENQYFPLLRLQGFVKGVAFDLARGDREPLPVLIDAIQRTGDDGQRALTAITIVDATDRRAYERELLRSRRSAEQLVAVLAEASDAVFTTTPAGEIETWNGGAGRLFGHAAREIVGTHLRGILCLGEDDAVWQQIMVELRAGRPVHREMTGTHASGHRVDLSVGLTPRLGLLSELLGVSAIVRDISERRETERLQREFLAMATMSCETRLPGSRGMPNSCGGAPRTASGQLTPSSPRRTNWTVSSKTCCSPHKSRQTTSNSYQRRSIWSLRPLPRRMRLAWLRPGSASRRPVCPCR